MVALCALGCLLGCYALYVGTMANAPPPVSGKAARGAAKSGFKVASPNWLSLPSLSCCPSLWVLPMLMCPPVLSNSPAGMSHDLCMSESLGTAACQARHWWSAGGARRATG